MWDFFPSDSAFEALNPISTDTSVVNVKREIIPGVG